MKGACVCGAVTVETTRRPELVMFCDCTLCRKVGAAWGYFQPDEVTVTGPTSRFMRANDDPKCRVHFCTTCGTTTHFDRPEGKSQDLVAVNARLFEEADLDGIEAHFPDGRNWQGQWPPDYRSEPARFGERPLP